MNPAAFFDLIETIERVVNPHVFLDEIIIFYPNEKTTYIIQEGKWIKTKSNNNIRIDNPTHGAGQTHAHIYGRKGDKIGVVNIDGSPSHGSKLKLTKKDADTLIGHGFKIPNNRIIEWIHVKDLLIDITPE